MTSGPSPIIALVITLAVVGALLGAVFAVGAFSPSGPTILSQPGSSREQTCPPTTTVKVNGTVYWSCSAILYWSANTSLMFAVQQLATVSFQGVLFNISGQRTMDCPVVNVTGREPTAATYSLLIGAVPFDCQLTQPTVFSPDHDFGATWNGVDSIQVLVRPSYIGLPASEGYAVVGGVAAVVIAAVAVIVLVRRRKGRTTAAFSPPIPGDKPPPSERT